jgi:mxaJ protein
VARNEVDVAIAWSPLAGYFVQHEPVTLEMAPVPSTDPVHLPMAFDISMGLRRDDVELERSLERVLVNRRQDIHQLLVG